MLEHDRLKRRGRAALCTALALAGSACTTASTTTSQNTYAGGEGRETETTVGNSKLEWYLEMVDMRHQRRDGRLFVQFKLKNKQNSDMKLEWSIEWYDEDGFAIDSERRWTPVKIAGKGFETIAVTGPVPAASIWELNVRPPNTVK